MPITCDDWSYRYQEMKAKLEWAYEYERAAAEDARVAYAELYTEHANSNNQLLHEYGLEGETDARDIIVRQEAALMNMRDRNANLVSQNRNLKMDVEQLEAWIDNGGPQHDDTYQDDKL